MRALLVAAALALLLVPSSATAIPPCLETGPTVTASSRTAGSVSAQDPSCYVWGEPWYYLYSKGVPSHVVLVLP